MICMFLSLVAVRWWHARHTWGIRARVGVDRIHMHAHTCVCVYCRRLIYTHIPERCPVGHSTMIHALRCTHTTHLVWLYTVSAAVYNIQSNLAIVYNYVWMHEYAMPFVYVCLVYVISLVWCLVCSMVLVRCWTLLLPCCTQKDSPCNICVYACMHVCLYVLVYVCPCIIHVLL